MSLRVTFLGTGGTFPTRARNTPSVILTRPGESLMFDCGEGTQRQLLDAPVSFMKITRIFLSHIHGDHYFGLPGLLQSMALNGREKEPVAIYAPAESIALVEAFLKAGYWTPPFPLTFVGVAPGETVRLDGYDVVACRAVHPVPSLSYAYREHPRPGRFDRVAAIALGVPVGPLFSQLQDGRSVEVAGRTVQPTEVCGPSRPGLSVVYSGDTAYNDDLVALSRGADLLILDSTADDEHEAKAVQFGHMSSRQAATVAKKAGARRLVLVHISPRFEDAAPMLAQAREVFAGTEMARDLGEITVLYPDQQGATVRDRGAATPAQTK